MKVEDSADAAAVIETASDTKLNRATLASILFNDPSGPVRLYPGPLALPRPMHMKLGHEDFDSQTVVDFTRTSTSTPMATSIMSCCRLFTRSLLPSQCRPNQLRWNSSFRASEAGVSADRSGRLGPNGGVLLSEAQVQGLFDYPEFKHPSREVSAYKRWRLVCSDFRKP